MIVRGCTRKAFNKKTIQASFTGHLTGLPHDILALFQPGPPLVYVPPVTKKRKSFVEEGIASYAEKLVEEPKSENPATIGKKFLNKEYQHQVRISETMLEKKAREAKERYLAIRSTNLLNNFDPTADPNIDGNPFKTLFVARLSYDTTERRLREEFEDFGSISRIRIVTDKLSGKPRGYAFIEFERLEEMKRAYKLGMNRSIDGKRVIVDVERGRTVADWRPRRLGGGLNVQTHITSFKYKSIKQNDEIEPIKTLNSNCFHKEHISIKQEKWENQRQKELKYSYSKQEPTERYSSRCKERQRERPYDRRISRSCNKRNTSVDRNFRSGSSRKRYQTDTKRSSY
jgi:U1 small nuclear ribonucleoprotein